MNKISGLFVISTLVSLAGCMPQLPIYKPSTLDRTIPVDMHELSIPQICINNQWYNVTKDQNGFVRIPYGRRISITDNYVGKTTIGYIETIISCLPAVSFIPQKGKEYYADFSINQGICRLYILKKNSNTGLGLIPESTLGPSTCSAPPRIANDSSVW